MHSSAILSDSDQEASVEIILNSSKQRGVVLKIIEARIKIWDHPVLYGGAYPVFRRRLKKCVPDATTCFEVQ